MIEIAGLRAPGAAGEGAGPLAEQDLSGLALGDLVCAGGFVAGDVDDRADQDGGGGGAPLADLFGGDRATGVVEASDGAFGGAGAVAGDRGLGEVHVQ